MLRTYHRMIIDLDGDSPSRRGPPLELRPFDPDRHGRQLKDALDEAFVDEWGHELRDYESWEERVLGVPQFDPERTLVVWDGDEIAAALYRSPEAPRRLGPRLAARGAGEMAGQGLGLSLLHESFRRFADRGETTAALGVDSENQTGATRLYERAGMRILWRADVWRKKLCHGA